MKFIKIFLFILIAYTSVAQTSTDPNFVKMQNLRYDGDDFYDLKEYHLALPFYLKVLELSPDDVDANYKVGVCHLNSTHSREALPYFEKIIDKEGVPKDIEYEIARAYHLTHQFDKAIEKYNKSKKHINGRNGLTIEMIDKEIERCKYGKILVETPLDFKIENIGDVINTEYRDHVPVISADETSLIFTSRRPNTVGGKLYKGDGMYFEDVYESKKDLSSGEWLPPQNMGEGINTKSHDASVGLSPDGKMLFIYRSEKKRNRVEGHIFTSEWDGELWSEPVLLDDHISSNYVELSASVTGDENMLFFSSDRPGGKGGFDIYQVKKLPNGEWAQPQNMTQLNTPDDDDAPFIHSDNRTLYFSSKGHQTMGGYDIFQSVFNEETGKWNEPQNMGYPVNTAGDDIYFVWSADGERGYFSSAREDSYGDLDIYVVHRPIIGKYFMVLKGTLIDEDTKKPIPGLIKLYNTENDKLIGVFNTRMPSGKFSAIVPPNAVYKAEVEAVGYDKKTEIIVVPDVKEYFEHEITLQAKKSKDTIVTAKVDTPIVKEVVEVIENVDEEEEGELAPGFLLRSVLHGFDQAAHEKGSGINIDDVIKILKENPWLVISIESHTDSKGSAEYNMKLSERRAASCKTYLLRRGISKTRVKVKYYGEEDPVAPNTHKNGKDNPEGRALNRRTEFRVVSNKPF